ncbi:pPIWI-associating nuclease domain-containing protein [Elizabethkingia ursingii]
MKLDNLWIGANLALESDNPDKLRHCLISLRTILEYIIDYKLAPIEKIKDEKMFEVNFKKYHQNKQKIEYVKISRNKKIEYFTNKFKFGLLVDFTTKDIQYICDCYSILCNVHQPNIGITENQVRSLKIKTGITIWLLCYLYKLSETKTADYIE